MFLCKQRDSYAIKKRHRFLEGPFEKRKILVTLMLSRKFT